MTLRSKRSCNNYSAPILTDLVRTDDIIIDCGNVSTCRLFQFIDKASIAKT